MIHVFIRGLLWYMSVSDCSYNAKHWPKTTNLMQYTVMWVLKASHSGFWLWPLHTYNVDGKRWTFWFWQHGSHYLSLHGTPVDEYNHFGCYNGTFQCNSTHYMPQEPNIGVCDHGLSRGVRVSGDETVGVTPLATPVSVIIWPNSIGGAFFPTNWLYFMTCACHEASENLPTVNVCENMVCRPYSATGAIDDITKLLDHHTHHSGTYGDLNHELQNN